jgi:plastocyanin
MLHGSEIRIPSRWPRAISAGVLVATLGVAMPLGAVPPVSSAGSQIEIRGDEYIPSALTVPAGTTVTWINHDDDVHTVSSATEVFHSPGIDTDETFTYTFAHPGTYEYFCKLHPLMTGRIVVR